MNRAAVVVVGSVNADLDLEMDRFPQPGETITARSLLLGEGGKGANAAVAAASMGADVALVAAIGEADSASILASLSRSGVDVAGIRLVDERTGYAIVLHDADRENVIIRTPGANDLLTPAAVRSEIESRRGSVKVVLANLEIPNAAVLEAARAARDVDALFVLDPAPATRLDDELVALCFALLPNESELAMLGLDDRARAVGNLIETRGAGGVRLHSSSGPIDLPAFEVTAVDTVGAGDAFAGAFAARLSETTDLHDILRFASAAGALSAASSGARVGFLRRQVEELMNDGNNIRMGAS